MEAEEMQKSTPQAKKIQKPPTIKIDGPENFMHDKQKKPKPGGQVHLNKNKKSKSSLNLFSQDRSNINGNRNKGYKKRQNTVGPALRKVVTKPQGMSQPDDNPDGQNDTDIDAEKYAILLRPRTEILCYKFIENIRKQLEKKYGRKYEDLGKKGFFTEMIEVNEAKRQHDSKDVNTVDTLEKYIESLEDEKSDDDANESSDPKNDFEV